MAARGGVGCDGQGSQRSGVERLQGCGLAYDRGLEGEARTCIESKKLCVWGGSREPPPAESVTKPPGGTSAWASSWAWSCGSWSHWPSCTRHHSMSARTRRSAVAEPEERRGWGAVARGRTLEGMAEEREDG